MTVQLHDDTPVTELIGRWVGFQQLVEVAEIYAPGAMPWQMGPLVGRWCETPDYFVDSVYVPSPFPLVRSWPEGFRS